MEPPTQSFAEWIIEQRERRGWTQAMLADRAGLKRNDMNAIEKGRVTLPGADKRRKLADALGLRHVDILVAACELSHDEIPAAGEPRPVFEGSDPRREILHLLIQLKVHDASELGWLRHSLEGLIAEQRPSKQPSSD